MGELLGAKRVFMDVEDISPGQNFAQRIDQTMGACSTVLVVIGPRWLDILQERAKQNQEDYVRHEIESALTRKTVVIPVLVGGASATEFNGLPAGLAELSMRQAFELRDSSFKDDCNRLARSLGSSPFAHWRTVSLVTAAVAVLAVILFFLAVAKRDSVRRREHKQSNPAVAQLLVTAKTQLQMNEYQGAYRSSTEAVKLAPLDTAALKEQVDAAMLWLEHYSVLTREDQKAEDLASPQLTELMNVLYTGLARTSGKEPRSADILAHIGWAHWLNRHIAQAEFGPEAEQAFRRALTIEPGNVYANAMLGNWQLQNRTNLAEALQHIATALATGRERPLVRSMQLGGMLDNDSTGIPSEAVKALNDMRKNHEPLSESYKRRFLSVNFNPVYTYESLSTILTAVPPDEEWQTYLWLDDAATSDSDSGYKQVKRDFFQASILEVEGKKPEAVAAFKALQANLKAKQMDGRITANVTNALSRLSKTH